MPSTSSRQTDNTSLTVRPICCNSCRRQRETFHLARVQGSVRQRRSITFCHHRINLNSTDQTLFRSSQSWLPKTEDGAVHKIADIFLLIYRTAPKSILLQHCPTVLFFLRKSRTTLDLPTRQPAGRDLKIEQQFSGRHGAVARNFDCIDNVHFRFRGYLDERRLNP